MNYVSISSVLRICEPQFTYPSYLFSNYGEVRQVNIIEGKAFGFVEMSNQPEAERAKEALNGSEFKGGILKVDEARPPRSRQIRGHRR